MIDSPETDPSRRWSLDELPREAGSHVDRLVRAAFFVVVVVTLGMAALGWTGPLRTTTSDRGDEVVATVHYDSVTRPGLAVSWRLELETVDGSELPALEVTVPNDYFDLYDENGLTPIPDAERGDGDHTTWEYDPPGASSLSIVFDARVQPAWHGPEDGDTVVVAGDDVLHLDVRTWVLP